jgi:hypothetical protein
MATVVALLMAAAVAQATAWTGPGTGTAYTLETGLEVVATTNNISPLDRTSPANLLVNGDFTDNGWGQATPTAKGWGPLSTNANSLNYISSVVTGSDGIPYRGIPLSVPNWYFTGGGTDTYAMWLPGTSAAVGPWANGRTQWGPYGSKNGASNPQIYFGNNENWSVSPSVASLLASNVFTEDVTQTALTFTPGTDSRWSTTSKSYQSSRAPTAFQTIPTSVGHTYCLSFWVGHEYFGETVGSRLDGLARLQIGGYNSVFFKVPTKIGSAGERWYTFQFEAKATTTRLSFTSWGHIGQGSTSSTELVLDDVVVNHCASAAPPTPVAVGDIVWFDTNANGVQDAGEAGVPGVQVQLLKADGTIATDVNGNPVAAVTTDAQGAYLIDNVPPGSYKAQFTLPSGYAFTAPSAAGGTSATDSNPSPTANPLVGVTPTFTIAGSATGDTTAVTGNPNASFANLTIDAGVVRPVGAGNYVWIDANGDGIQDAGELPLAGVVVELLTASGQPATDAQGNLVATQTTDAQGAYFFGNLLPGTYTMRFTLPSGATFSPTGSGTSATDSDATPGVNLTVGTTAPFTISGSATGDTTAVTGNSSAAFANLTIDIGVIMPVSSGSGGGSGSGTGSGGTSSGGSTPTSGGTTPPRGTTTTTSRNPSSGGLTSPVPASALNVDVVSTNAYAVPGDQISVTVQVENTSTSPTAPTTIGLAIPSTVQVSKANGAKVKRGTATWKVDRVPAGKTVSRTLRVTAIKQGPVRFSVTMKTGNVTIKTKQEPLKVLPAWVQRPSLVTG